MGSLWLALWVWEGVVEGSGARVGTIAGLMAVGSSRRWRKIVEAAGWGSVRLVPV